jgi:photosystem II stability/assembly factor-like uncharacterized protein
MRRGGAVPRRDPRRRARVGSANTAGVSTQLRWSVHDAAAVHVPRGRRTAHGAPAVGRAATLYRTTNGGLGWTQRSTPEAVPQALDFINTDDGWLLIADSENAGPAGLPDLWVTHNGGITWTSLESAPINASTGYSPTIDLGGLNLDFLTTEVGWAAPPWTAEPLGAPDLMQTSDGGKDWVLLTPSATGVPPSQ